jgi:hypothetical protein
VSAPRPLPVRWGQRLAIVLYMGVIALIILNGFFGCFWLNPPDATGLQRGIGLEGGCLVLLDGPSFRVTGWYWMYQRTGWHWWFTRYSIPAGNQTYVPLWIPLLLFGILAHWLAPLVFARGLCQKCGYDLRGAPNNRCPECGEFAKVKVSETAT